jgi:hypothetical protein
MKLVAGVLIVAVGSLLWPIVADEIPGPIVQRAEAFVLERVGETVYQEYVEFVDAKIVQPSSTCLQPDSKCDPEFTRPYHHFEFSFRIPHKPFVDERLSFSLDEDGAVIEKVGVYGIPECAADPAECDFDRVDAVAAEKIAREYGLAAGIKYWKVDFAWYSITRTYAWSVTATSEQRDGYAEGETLLIDANSGEIMGSYNWFQHSCGG